MGATTKNTATTVFLMANSALPTNSVNRVSASTKRSPRQFAATVVWPMEKRAFRTITAKIVDAVTPPFPRLTATLRRAVLMDATNGFILIMVSISRCVPAVFQKGNLAMANSPEMPSARLAFAFRASVPRLAYQPVTTATATTIARVVGVVLLLRQANPSKFAAIKRLAFTMTRPMNTWSFASALFLPVNPVPLVWMEASTWESSTTTMKKTTGKEKMVTRTMTMLLTLQLAMVQEDCNATKEWTRPSYVPLVSVFKVYVPRIIWTVARLAVTTSNAQVPHVPFPALSLQTANAYAALETPATTTKLLITMVSIFVSVRSPAVADAPAMRIIAMPFASARVAFASMVCVLTNAKPMATFVRIAMIVTAKRAVSTPSTLVPVK
mmetsp:Transcript_1340/g.2186  ORF Transcript_1340/g.2186 Transcript_1340/m.2186 type:complete len:382 (-) Transcript_1340:1022-2167(-)